MTGKQPVPFSQYRPSFCGSPNLVRANVYILERLLLEVHSISIVQPAYMDRPESLG